MCIQSAREILTILLLLVTLQHVQATPTLTSLRVKNSTTITLIYNDTVSAPLINTLAGKNQYSVKMDSAVKTINAIQISSNIINIATEKITAATTVQLAYTKSDNQSLEIKSSSTNK